jgi:hypothetical protein
MVTFLSRSATIGRFQSPRKFEGLYMDLKLEETTKTLYKAGFVIRVTTARDALHFGNWVLIATRAPLALRVINDRGIVLLDLMEWDAFEGEANESEWFNWDVVARALGLPEENGEDQLWSLLSNLRAVEHEFLRENWATTRGLLHKIEAEKRRRFMEGGRISAHA